MRVLTFVPLIAALLTAHPAAADEPVDVMLVLVTDVSRSVDDTEFTLEKQGYSAALTDQQVLAAIKGGPIGQIAVAYVEFAGSYEVRTVVDWHVVKDAATAAAFTREIEAAPRSYWGRTSISAGIDHAMQMLTEGGFEAQRRVIDVAGDGTNNSGRDVTDARDEAVKAGVTVNGLAIINEHPLATLRPRPTTRWPDRLVRRQRHGGPAASSSRSVPFRRSAKR